MYGIIEPDENFPNITNTKCALSQCLTKEMYSKLYWSKTMSGYTIDRAIQIGIDCEEEDVGFLLGDYECIEVFEPLLGAIIGQIHPSFDYKDTNLSHIGNLKMIKFDGTQTLKGFVIEYAFHLRRNLRGYSLPPHCTRAERREINRILIYILKQLHFDQTLPHFQIHQNKLKEKREGQTPTPKMKTPKPNQTKNKKKKLKKGNSSNGYNRGGLIKENETENNITPNITENENENKTEITETEQTITNETQTEEKKEESPHKNENETETPNETANNEQSNVDSAYAITVAHVNVSSNLNKPTKSKIKQKTPKRKKKKKDKKKRASTNGMRREMSHSESRDSISLTSPKIVREHSNPLSPKKRRKKKGKKGRKAQTNGHMSPRVERSRSRSHSRSRGSLGKGDHIIAMAPHSPNVIREDETITPTLSNMDITPAPSPSPSPMEQSPYSIIDKDEESKSQVMDLVTINDYTLTELEEMGLAPSRTVSLTEQYLIGGLSRDFPDARTLFFNRKAMVGAWTNHENHLEIIIQHCAPDLNYIYSKFVDIYVQFRRILKRKEMAWIRHRRLGIVTTSPKHLGTGLTIQCSIRAPYLSVHPKFERILNKRSLELISMSDEDDGIVNLETMHTLGRSEWQITMDLGTSLIDLCRMEKALARNKDIEKLI